MGGGRLRSRLCMSPECLFVSVLCLSVTEDGHGTSDVSVALVNVSH